MIEYYFAYGSNLNMEQMKARCPGSIPICKGEVANARLVFKTYADVIKSQAKVKTSHVPGAIYKVTPKDIRALDRYEGVAAGFYKKVRVKVITDEYARSGITCFMYVMCPKVRRPALPSEEYFNVCAQGYRDWNLPLHFLLHAWDVTAEKLNPELRLGYSSEYNNDPTDRYTEEYDNANRINSSGN